MFIILIIIHVLQATLWLKTSSCVNYTLLCANTTTSSRDSSLHKLSLSSQEEEATKLLTQGLGLCARTMWSATLSVINYYISQQFSRFTTNLCKLIMYNRHQTSLMQFISKRPKPTETNCKFKSLLQHLATCTVTPSLHCSYSKFF